MRELHRYTLARFLAQPDRPLDPQGYREASARAAPALAAYLVGHGQPTTTAARQRDIAAKAFRSWRRGWAMDWAGFSIAVRVDYLLCHGHDALEEGDRATAGTLWDFAEDHVRLGRSMVDFDGKRPSALEREIARVHREGGFCDDL